MDDVIVQAIGADGSSATLEIQAKRTLAFTRSDKEFRDIVRRMWLAAQKPEFISTSYELAVAIARSTTRIEQACQEVLHWARQQCDAATFDANINLDGFASDPMRDFVTVFRENLVAAGAPSDPDTVWRLLRRFNILVFDFETPGSDYEHRARERGRIALVPEHAARATELWPILEATALDLARAGGDIDRVDLKRRLKKQYGLRFGEPADLRNVNAKLAAAAQDALGDIKDQVGGVRLSRTLAVARGETLLDAHRLVVIHGEAGVGKSAVIKHLAQRLAPQGSTIVLAPGRIIAGGWLAMANVLGCPGAITRDELFNELGCGGAATLFVDNIDQLDDDGEWATITDLLRGVLANPGWRAVVTSRARNDAWQSKLPQELVAAGMAPLLIEEISDAETAVLAAGNPALSALLNSTHPARAIARNLFYLSQLVELTAAQPHSAVGLASETDLAKAWWRYGGGRNDDGRLARLKILRALGTQVLAHPGQAAFRVDDFDASIVTELLHLQGLREVRQGATITFRHDVQRDWTLGMLLEDEPARLKALALAQPIPGALTRSLEIAARLALEADATGQRWLSLLAAVEQDGCHGSWRRPILLALPRSERAFMLLQGLEGALLQDKGRRLGDIIRLVMAVDSEPLATLLARTQPNTAIPQGADGLIIPKGSSWTALVIWLTIRADALPSALIPDIARLYFSWLIATQRHAAPINALIVDRLFDWLMRIEEAMHPALVHDMREARQYDLDFAHVRDVREDIRTTCFGFCHLSPPAAERYVTALDPDKVRYDETQFLLRGPGALARTAPAPYVDFALASLIEKDDPDDPYARNNGLGPFGTHDGLFTPPAPTQGAFFELLEHAPAEGLRLVRGVIQHARHWRRKQYVKARRPFPATTIPFPEGAKTLHGGFSTYLWSRTGLPSAAASSALMALEAWAHRQVESGRPFADVLHDVLGPSGSSVAFLAVAADLALSHWDASRPVVWPLLATPELLCWDHWRFRRDLTGADRLLRIDQEANSAQVTRSDLDARVSRRSQLIDCIGDFTLHGPVETHASLRSNLQQARDRIAQSSPEREGRSHPRLAASRRTRFAHDRRSTLHPASSPTARRHRNRGL
jgi:ABC-type cobalamin/Fe3+-siderophores transport system ATPase subunit